MRRLPQPQTRLVALGAVVLAAFAFRLWGITWGLYDANVARRPHPDEWVLYWVFHWFGLTGTLNPCPHASRQCFFDWGSVYLYLSYGVHLLLSSVLDRVSMASFGPHADPVFIRAVLAGRLTSAIASAATVVVVYRFGSRAYGPSAGLLAGVLVACAGLLIQLGHFATPDATMGLLMTASLLAMYAAVEQPALARFCLAGVLVGLSAGTEYHMALLAAPLTAAWLLSHTGRGTDLSRLQLDAPLLVASYACAALAFIASNPYALVDLPAFASALAHTVRIRTVDSQAQYQGRWAAYGPSWLYVLRYPLGYGVGWALTLWMVAGLGRALQRRSRADLLLLAWVVPYGLLVTLSTAKFMRYSAPLIPTLALLGGALAAEVGTWRWRKARLLAGAMAACAILLSTAYDAAYAGLFVSPDARSLAAAWFSSHVSPGSQVAFEELPNGLMNLPYYLSAEGYRPCFPDFQSARLGGPMDYVVLDSYGLEEHPDVSRAEVLDFRAALNSGRSFKLVEQVQHVPTFLGIRFSIDGSPHDWRYPSREISIYQRRGPTDNRRLGPSLASPSNRAVCYPDLSSAIAALYVPPRTKGRLP